MITIRVMSADGALLAQAAHESEALLHVDREYQTGDVIVIESDNKHLIVQMDATILPGEVYLPEGKMTWTVPAGEHRLAYCPVAFEGRRHIVTARHDTGGSLRPPQSGMQSVRSARRYRLLPALYGQRGNARRELLCSAQRH